jgi:hypothetical protein
MDFNQDEQTWRTNTSDDPTFDLKKNLSSPIFSDLAPGKIPRTVYSALWMAIPWIYEKEVFSTYNFVVNERYKPVLDVHDLLQNSKLFMDELHYQKVPDQFIKQFDKLMFFFPLRQRCRS